MTEDTGERQDTGIGVVRTRNSAGRNHYTTYRLRRRTKMEKKRCEKCWRKGAWGCPSRDGNACARWVEKPLSPTMAKLDAMLREVLR